MGFDLLMSTQIISSYKLLLLLIEKLSIMGAMQSVCGDNGMKQKESKRIKQLQKDNRKKQAIIQRLEQDLVDQRKARQNQIAEAGLNPATKQKEVSALKTSLNDNIQPPKQESKELIGEIQRLKKQVKDYELKTTDYERLQLKQMQLQDEKQKLATQLKGYEDKISDFERLKAQNKQTNQKQDFQKIIQEYQSKILLLRTQIKQKESYNQELEENLKQIQERDRQLQKKQQELQKVICNLRDQLQQIRQKEQREQQGYQKLINELNYKIKVITDQKQEIHMQINKAKDELTQKQHKLHQTSKQSEQQTKKIADQMKRKSEKYESSLKEKDWKIQQLNEELAKLQKNKQIQVYQKKDLPTNGLKEKLDQYIFQLDRVRLSRNRMSRAVAEMKFNNFFNAELLQEENDYKQFLASVIESRINKKIAKTKLIYKYDELNKINLHKYIDNKYFLVLIIKLQNGYFLAAFTEGPFYPKMQSKYDGLIISLTNRKIFTPLVQNKRAISYDDFFVIFGNSEVRLKTQQKKLFSNFAISNGYYSANGEKVSILLGTNQREVGLESYEFYELVFKQ